MLNKTQIEVYEEYHDGNFLTWVSYYPALDLYSQGRTKEEAIDAIRMVVFSWVKIMMGVQCDNYNLADDFARMEVVVVSPKCWKG